MERAANQPNASRGAPPARPALWMQISVAAGETSTTLCSLIAAGYAWGRGIPGGNVLFFVMVIFDLIATVTTALIPRGDYAKALRALRAPAPR